MNQKLTWSEIEKRYTEEWVHLVDYDWGEGDPYPSAGVVNVHAKTRKEFNQLLLASAPLPGARVFVGRVVPNPENPLSMGCFKVTRCA